MTVKNNVPKGLEEKNDIVICITGDRGGGMSFRSLFLANKFKPREDEP